MLPPVKAWLLSNNINAFPDNINVFADKSAAFTQPYYRRSTPLPLSAENAIEFAWERT